MTVVVTSNPASRITSAAASAFACRRSANTTRFPALTLPSDRLTDRSGSDDDNNFGHVQYQTTIGEPEGVTVVRGTGRVSLVRPNPRMVGAMDARNDIREFLISRRGNLTPEQAGLPDYGGKRRVTGLRREEVSMLAGISVEYYTRLERGNANGVSEDVLEGIVRALQLDEAERAHLFDLVRARRTRPGRRVAGRPRSACARPCSESSTR